jgi:assimilatory nitrate reductase catalytic subunit
VRRGEVFAPIHWTGETAPTGRIDALVRAVTDPVSGQPDLKATGVAVRPFAAGAFAFAASTRPFRPVADYWALAASGTGSRAELAFREAPADWEAAARALFGLPEAEAISVVDHRRGIARIALVENGRVLAALFAGPEPVAVARMHVQGMIGTADPTILAARPGADRPDPGPIVCACLSVGVNTIIEGIATK